MQPGSSILRSFTKSDTNPYFISGSAGFLDQHDHTVKWAQANRDLVSHHIKYCLFDKGPNPLDAEEGADTDTPTIAEVDEPKVGEDDPDVDPGEAQCGGVAAQDWNAGGQPQEVRIH